MAQTNILKILLVDDERFQYDIVRDLLAEIQLDGQVDWADSAAAGREKILSQDYDVCLVDYTIGKDNGVELLREMSAAGYRVPMILFTGHGSRQVGLEALNAGAADYLDKLGLTSDKLERSIRYAIEHARVKRALETRSRAEIQQRLLAEALLDSTAALNSTLDLNEVLGRILANIGKHVPHDAASVMLIEAGQAHVVDCHGSFPAEDEEAIRAARYNVFDIPVYRQMIETNQPLVIPDIQTCPFWTADVPQVRFSRSYVGTPISQGDEVIGFINLESFTPGFYTDAHKWKVYLFADHAAIAIHNAQTYQRAQKYAALEERQRLARDLHDSVNQTLFSASVIAGSLELLIKQDPRDAAEKARILARMTKGALAEIRILLMELRSSSLEQHDLGTLVQYLATALMGQTEAQVTVSNGGEKSVLPDDVKMGLYRMIQEALNNIAKHASARGVMIHLQSLSNGMTVQIMDDGCGFDANAIAPGHMGLHIMRERADAIGAAVNVTSVVGQGTQITIEWPAETRDRDV